MNYDDALRNCIFRFVSGSHAYGTERPDSDMDYRGVFIAPLDKAFELFQSSFVGSGTIEQQLKSAIGSIENGLYDKAIEHVKTAMSPEYGDLNLSVGTVHKAGEDEELQELRKFFKLAAESNPNIIEFLWVDRLISVSSKVWEKIRANRGMFLSKKARFTFSGYAHAQLKRIETHRGYLLSPPDHKPTRQEFGLPEQTEIAKENQNAILSLPDKWIQADARDYVRREKQYQAALEKWNDYKKWENERNPARKAMEARWGYDIKHATHLVRLSRMGEEILRDGVVNVYRPDREELRGILRGEWTYDRLIEHATAIDGRLDDLYAKSPLRNKPDHKGISELYKEICQEHYGIKL